MLSFHYAECYYAVCYYAECRGTFGALNELHSGMFETILPGTNALAYFASMSVAK
jgi:hypothetical protein